MLVVHFAEVAQHEGDSPAATLSPFLLLLFLHVSVDKMFSVFDLAILELHMFSCL